MTGWVGCADESFDRATDLAGLYASGVRVLAGYAGPGSTSKHLTVREITAWAACGPDTGILALCEGVGDEPIRSPSSGASLARSSRTGWRALGLPDTVPINHAVDRNITAAQWQGPVAAYFTAAAKADTTPPTAYVERGAGEWLSAHGHIPAYGTPAAYAWDSSGSLVTPADAPTRCFWTQEHNGAREDGGTLDLGHVRAGSPCVWWLHDTDGDDMALTPDDGKTVLSTDIIPNPAQRADSPGHDPAGDNPTTTAWFALGDMWQRVCDQQDALAALAAQVTALATQVSALQAALAAAAPVPAPVSGDVAVTGTLHLGTPAAGQ